MGKEVEKVVNTLTLNEYKRLKELKRRNSNIQLDVCKGFNIEYPSIDKKLPRHQLVKAMQYHLGVKLLNQRKSVL